MTSSGVDPVRSAKAFSLVSNSCVVSPMSSAADELSNRASGSRPASWAAVRATASLAAHSSGRRRVCIELVCVASGEVRSLLPAGPTDDDAWRAWRRTQRERLELEVWAIMAGRVRIERSSHIRQGILQQSKPLRSIRVGNPKTSCSAVHPAGADPEREPTSRHVVDRDSRLGEHRRVAEGDRRDQHAEFDAPMSLWPAPPGGQAHRGPVWSWLPRSLRAIR